MSTPMDKIIDDEILTDRDFYWRDKDGIRILVSQSLEDRGFANGFSTRLGGVSPFPKNDLNLAGFNEDLAENIHENRRRFLSLFDSDFRLACAWQVHGDAIRNVETLDDAIDSDEKCDALIADLPGVLLGVKTADCVPILIGDATTGAFAAVHAGWRGTVQSIVMKTVNEIRVKFNTNPADLIAAIGPSAGCKTYEIGQDVIDSFESSFENSAKYFEKTRDGHALINLQMANKDQLIGSGLDPSNISTAPFCTMERTDLFFSYRVEKQKYGMTGRLMSVIGRSAATI